LFHIVQPNGLLDPSTFIFSLDGEERHQGFELNLYGEPLEGLRIIGGFMYLDAKLTRTQDGLSDGKPADGKSKYNPTLGVDWQPKALRGLGLSAHLKHASEFYINSGAIEAPGWTTLDLGAHYSFNAWNNNPIVARLSVRNITNEAYWSSQYLYRGAPRTVLASLTMNF